MFRALVCGAALAASVAAPLHADLSAKEAQVLLKEVYRLIKSGQHERAVEELGRGNDIRATKMLLKIVDRWGKKKRDKYNRAINPHALRSRIVNGFMFIEDPKSWELLMKHLTGRKYRDVEDLWMRYSIAEALGKKAQDHAFKKIIELVRHEDHQVRALGAFALYHRGNRVEAMEGMWEAFGDERWQVRHMALLALCRVRAPLAQTRYWERLDQSTGRERADLLRGLRTMVAKRWSYQEWKDWYAKLGSKEKQQEFRADITRYMKDQMERYSRREWTEVLDFKREKFKGATMFGIKLRTKRLVILFDPHEKLKKLTTKSLPPGTVTSPEGKSLYEIMLAEIAQAIEKLPDDVEVAVISTDKLAQPISGKLKPLSEAGYREKLVKGVRERKASLSTNLYSAFERCYSMHHKHPLDDANFDKGPDTVILLTQGIPAHGKVAYRKVVLAGREPWDIEFRDAWEQIQYARQLRWHVIGFGKDQPAMFLRKLAEAGHGMYLGLK